MKSIVALLVLTFLLSTSSVFAEDSSISAKPERHLQRQEIKKEEMKDILRKQKDELHLLAEKRREELKKEIETKREEMKAMSEEKREALKERLQTVKDETKKQAAENLDEKLASLNKQQTDRMLEAVTKLSEFLDKVSSLSANIPSSEDTSALDTAIETAEEAIRDAEEAIATQAGKEYVATVTTEARLRQSFNTVVTQLKTDLKTTQESVKNARNKVRLAAVELAKLRSTMNTPTASQSAQ